MEQQGYLWSSSVPHIAQYFKSDRFWKYQTFYDGTIVARLTHIANDLLHCHYYYIVYILSFNQVSCSIQCLTLLSWSRLFYSRNYRHQINDWKSQRICPDDLHFNTRNNFLCSILYLFPWLNEQQASWRNL